MLEIGTFRDVIPEGILEDNYILGIKGLYFLTLSTSNFSSLEVLISYTKKCEPILKGI